MSGSMIPCSRMDAASSSRRASSKCFLGWSGFRSTSSIGSVRIARPGGPAVGNVTTLEGGGALESRAAIPRPSAGLRLSAMVTRRLRQR